VENYDNKSEDEKEVEEGEEEDEYGGFYKYKPPIVKNNNLSNFGEVSKVVHEISDVPISFDVLYKASYAQN